MGLREGEGGEREGERKWVGEVRRRERGGGEGKEREGKEEQREGGGKASTTMRTERPDGRVSGKEVGNGTWSSLGSVLDKLSLWNLEDLRLRMPRDNL